MCIIISGDEMFKMYNWKQPIYKDDLKAVILNGLLFSILGGVLAGTLDYLMDLLNLAISFGLVILTYMVGMKVKKSFYTYHILYPVLGIVFLTLGLFISYFTSFLMIYRSLDAFKLFLSPYFYLNFILQPVTQIITFFRNGYNPLYLIIGLLNLFIIVWAYVYCYKLIKGRD